MTMTNAPEIADQGTQAPMFDLSAERILLGILMLDRNAIGKTDGITAEVFYRPQHGEVFDAIRQLHDEGKPTEPGAVAAVLADAGTIVRLGGAPFLQECVHAVPSTAHIGYYIERILSTTERRSLEAAGVRLTQAASSPSMAVDDIAAMAQDLIEKSKRSQKALEMVQLGSMLNPCLDDIEVRAGRPAGVKTGFRDLDKLLGGLRPRQLITVAGPTGSGKSIFLTDIARYAAIQRKLTVALFTFEMGREEVFERVLAAEANVPHMVIRDGTLTDEDWAKVSGKIGPMADAPLFIADDPPLTVAQIRARCERLRKLRGLDLVLIDLLHQVEPSQRCADERARLENLTRGLKSDLAMRLEVPVVAAAHLNRNPGARADKRPQLTDLKNSSSIEQDSDIVIMVHREDYYDKQSPRQGEVDLIVEKNRKGPKDTITVAGQLHKCRFVDMAIV